MTQLNEPTPPPPALNRLPFRSAAVLMFSPTMYACGSLGAMPQTCLPFNPDPIADSLSGPIAAP